LRRPVYVSGRGAVSCYGLGLEALTGGIYSGERGIRARVRTDAFHAPTRVAAEFPAECFAGTAETDLPFAAGSEACRQALSEARIADPSSIGLVLGSTKADIAGLMIPGRGLGFPARLAQRIASGLELACVHASVSTACASGLSAIAMAARRIECGEVERVLVLGVDTLSQFIMAGFGSMHILDPEPCRPFDASRRGISLGEGAGAMVLSSHASESTGFRIGGHAGANDAIHISGCDREGGGIALAVKRTLEHAGLGLDQLDFLHLHGTGTTANDASEAVGLGHAFDGPTPVAYGTKGQIGHTLGAGGVLESLITLAALERAEVPGNLGLREQGVHERLQLSRDPVSLERAESGMKLASGFGGIHQAVLYQR
jgi:3-oxoacyl-(acyl-carrier-protein) synthase